jgi:hypothetical protein
MPAEMRRLVICAVLVWSGCLPSYCQGNMPEYGTVLDTFFSRYNEAGSSPLREMRFEKRPERYVVSWFIKATGENDDSMLLWEDGRYYDLPFERQPAGSQPDRAPSYAFFQESHSAWLYDWLPAYGYTGYFNDIIEALEHLESPTDTQLFALAFAWSAAASHHALGWSAHSPSETLNTARSTPVFSDRDKESYLNLRKRSWRTYEQLLTHHPEFTTPAGSVHHLLSDDRMLAFLELLVLRGEAEASEMVTKGLYDAYILEAAENILGQCPSQCILISPSLTVTLPLMYVQVSQELRTDVRIVDRYLLQDPAFISLLRQQVGGAAGIPLRLPDSFYESPGSNLMSVNDQTESDTLSLDSFLLKAAPLAEANTSSGPLTLCPLPARVVSLPVSGQSLHNRGLISSRQAEALPEALTAYFSASGNQLLRRDIAMLDIIASTDWDPPLCAVMAGNGEKVFPIGYEWGQGLLARHSPIAPDRSREQYQYTPALFPQASQRLLSRLRLETFPAPLSPAHRIFWNGYVNAFLSTADAFHQQGEHAEALEVVGRFVETCQHIPSEYMPSLLPFVRLYLICGAEHKAIDLARAVLEPLVYAEGNAGAGSSGQKALAWIEATGRQHNSATLIALAGEFRSQLFRHR